MQSLFALLIISSCISAIRTDQCYFCNTSSGNGCGDPFDINLIGNKDKTALVAGGVCMKQKTKTKGGVVINRNAPSTSTACLGGANGCKKVKEAGVTVITCCCTGNLCNKVSTLQQQQPMIILCLAIAALVTSIYRHA